MKLITQKVGMFVSAILLFSCVTNSQMISKNSLSENALLESELYARYNYTKLKEIEQNKKGLMSRIKNGDKKAEATMSKLAKEEEIVQDNASMAQSVSTKVRKTLKIKPIPPCPPKDDGKCRLDALRELLVPSKVIVHSAKVIDQNGKTIGTLNNKPFMIDTKSGIKGYQFSMKKNYSGPVTIEISRTNADKKRETYKIPAMM